LLARCLVEIFGESIVYCRRVRVHAAVVYHSRNLHLTLSYSSELKFRELQ
jgi:hypothetical protein